MDWPGAAGAAVRDPSEVSWGGKVGERPALAFIEAASQRRHSEHVSRWRSTRTRSSVARRPSTSEAPSSSVRQRTDSYDAAGSTTEGYPAGGGVSPAPGVRWIV